MAKKKVLFISGSLGLGHIRRDLEIAGALRSIVPEIEITWLAAHPATAELEKAGEMLHPEVDAYANDNLVAEGAATDYGLNIMEYMMRAEKDWERNFMTFARITGQETFDAVVGDETYEIAIGLRKKPEYGEVPFAMIYDFCGLDAVTKNPKERLGAYLVNRMWSQSGRLFGKKDKIAIFIGELEDVPDRRFGFLLPNRRAHVREHYNVVGHVLSFDPAEFENRKAVKRSLGYGDAPLIVCTIGGTSVGKSLLDLSGRAFPLIREKVPRVQMLIVCGPRLSPDALEIPEGADVVGYVQDLYRHLAACDLAITQAGGTTTLELTALRRPFLYFPIEGHCEQELNVAYRLKRINAGVGMRFSRTTPEMLAEKAVENLGKKVDYPSVPTDGALKAAEHIAALLQ